MLILQTAGVGRMIVFRKMSAEDTALLTDVRVTVLRAANLLGDDADMSEIAEQSRLYYKRALNDGSHTAYLAFDSERVVGAGGVSYYTVMPTCDNVTGRKAYIMNMYTENAGSAGERCQRARHYAHRPGSYGGGQTSLFEVRLCPDGT